MVENWRMRSRSNGSGGDRLGLVARDRDGEPDRADGWPSCSSGPATPVTRDADVGAEHALRALGHLLAASSLTTAPR